MVLSGKVDVANSCFNYESSSYQPLNLTARQEKQINSTGIFLSVMKFLGLGSIFGRICHGFRIGYEQQVQGIKYNTSLVLFGTLVFDVSTKKLKLQNIKQIMTHKL